MAVYVGQQINDQAWFADHADDPAFLAMEATKATALAADITAHFRGDPTFRAHFAGWYLPFELDNGWFQEPATPTTPPPACPTGVTSAPGTPWENMAGCFFGPVSTALRRSMASGQRIITAPMFFAGTPYSQTTQQWAQMWAYLLSYSSIDTLAPQDGVGAEHATTGQLAPWYQAAASGVATANSRRGGAVQLWDDPESYLHGANMPTGMLVADIQAVQPYLSRTNGSGTCGPSPTARCGDYVSFQYLHMSRIEAPLYYAAYQQYAITGQLPAVTPAAPSGLTAQATDAQTVRLTWSPPVDPTVAGYDIYRWTGVGQPGPGDRVDTIYTPLPAADQCGLSSCLVDTQLQPGSTYSYAVASFNATGLESPAPASVTTPLLVVGADIALGRPYTATVAADPGYPDPAGTKLTDGAFGAPSDWTDPAWEGRLAAPPYSIVVDLGSTEPIAAVSSDWMQQPLGGIHLPASVTYSVSSDGSTWTRVGTVAQPFLNELGATSQRYQSSAPGLSGRWVKVDVQPYGATWSFVDEVQVFAPAA
jgi:hypothetical protein